MNTGFFIIDDQKAKLTDQFAEPVDFCASLAKCWRYLHTPQQCCGSEAEKNEFGSTTLLHTGSTMRHRFFFYLQGQVRIPEGVSECQIWSKAVDSSYNVQVRVPNNSNNPRHLRIEKAEPLR
jgi:hypothetical protein